MRTIEEKIELERSFTEEESRTKGAQMLRADIALESWLREEDPEAYEALMKKRVLELREEDPEAYEALMKKRVLEETNE